MSMKMKDLGVSTGKMFDDNTSRQAIDVSDASDLAKV